MALALEIHYYHNDHAIAFLSKDKLTLVESREVLCMNYSDLFFTMYLLKANTASKSRLLFLLKKDNLP
jgi:hypothetical protein